MTRRFATWYVERLDYLPDRLWHYYSRIVPRWLHRNTYGRCESKSIYNTWRN